MVRISHISHLLSIYTPHNGVLSKAGTPRTSYSCPPSRGTNQIQPGSGNHAHLRGVLAYNGIPFTLSALGKLNVLGAQAFGTFPEKEVILTIDSNGVLFGKDFG